MAGTYYAPKRLVPEQCVYKHWPYTKMDRVTPSSLDDTIKGLMRGRASDITGYSNGLMIVTNKKIFFCPYTYESVIYFWQLDEKIKAMINTYVEHKCENIEELKTRFMAKILGGKEK